MNGSAADGDAHGESELMAIANLPRNASGDQPHMPQKARATLVSRCKLRLSGGTLTLTKSVISLI